jgi:hypothetical protein
VRLLYGQLHVRVGENHVWGFAAELQRHALQVRLRGPACDELADL